MTYKDAVLEFMRIKDEIIFKYTELHIFDEEMFLEDFSEEDCKNFVVGETQEQGNALLCPWCIKYYSCNGCTFGQEYEICAVSTSLYQDIAAHFDKLFIKLPGMSRAWKKLLQEIK